MIFGSPEPGHDYRLRCAAYAVILDARGCFAAVRGGEWFFLPGGGAQPGESPRETIAREMTEELGRGIELSRVIGEATQYFYSETDNQRYLLEAVFIAGMSCPTAASHSTKNGAPRKPTFRKRSSPEGSSSA